MYQWYSPWHNQMYVQEVNIDVRRKLRKLKNFDLLWGLSMYSKDIVSRRCGHCYMHVFANYGYVQPWWMVWNMTRKPMCNLNVLVVAVVKFSVQHYCPRPQNLPGILRFSFTIQNTNVGSGVVRYTWSCLLHCSYYTLNCRSSN